MSVKPFCRGGAELVFDDILALLDSRLYSEELGSARIIKVTMIMAEVPALLSM